MLDVVDLSRLQFALTALYHFIFVPLTLGLSFVLVIMETIYVKTGKEVYKDMTKFWGKLFGINFALGVTTGIIMEFQFGTNWSYYSHYVGDIFGAPLAIEALLAFFLESTFVGLFFFGWDRLTKGKHLLATYCVAFGSNLSAMWILVANGWMQHPVAAEFNFETVRMEMTSFLDLWLNPVAQSKFLHTLTAGYSTGAMFVLGISAFYLLKGRDIGFAKRSFSVAATFGFIAASAVLIMGDESGYDIGKAQPVKLAAMEALYQGGKAQSLSLVAGVSPFQQPDYLHQQEPPFKIGAPYALSVLATNSFEGYVPGVQNILAGYTKNDGTKEPSVAEKIARGRRAIVALQQYRAGKRTPEVKQTLRDDMKYFGYGYVKSPDQVVPNIPINFWAFRIMVGLGMLFILYFLFAGHITWHKNIADDKWRWLCRAGIALVPLAYVATESGWIVAEMGRQPWTIQDLLPTWAAVSDLNSGSIIITFFLFLALFTTMLAVEINILFKQIKKGMEAPSV